MAGALELVLTRTLIAMLVAGIGGTFAILAKNITHRQLCALISLAAGSLLYVALFEIVPETIGMMEWAGALAAFASGYALFCLIGRYVYHICPACAATHKEERFLAVGALMALAISIHSTMDGISIATAQEIGSGIGIVIFFAVAIHKFPEGLALTSVARGGGYGRAKALELTILIQLTTALGGFVAVLFVGSIPQEWLGAIMAHAGGGFLYLVLHALLGEMVKHERKSILAYSSLGFVILFLLSLGAKILGFVD